MSSPTQRSLKHLRDTGWTCQVVEHWNPYAKIRQDLFGFADIIALKKFKTTNVAEHGIALIQCTSITNFSARKTKVLLESRAALWRECGGLIFVHGWGKRGPRGKRKTWVLREEKL